MTVKQENIRLDSGTLGLALFQYSDSYSLALRIETEISGCSWHGSLSLNPLQARELKDKLERILRDSQGVNGVVKKEE